ncbi:hypothetical protein CKO18_15750 [Rhodoferax fermentans]|uniref:Uncharacterized protein n=2 Tax=Rhodoferax fermentans TaxID=28066 RepID=A0A1T1AU01_RHOFE|nr:hypothetical protein [Rhodoferax fermentans]OOV07428.1 hypothetical protein RF819_12435 [Rhodoferax fermentans]
MFKPTEKEPAMSHVSLFNLIATFGIVFAIVFAIWVHRQTRQIQDTIHRMRTRRQGLRRGRSTQGARAGYGGHGGRGLRKH